MINDHDESCNCMECEFFREEKAHEQPQPEEFADGKASGEGDREHAIKISKTDKGTPL